jgi:uncharacterized protein involved in response to NO
VDPVSLAPATKEIYGLITVAALLRILSPLAGDLIELALWLAGAAWSCAFGLFAVVYGFVLARPRINHREAAESHVRGNVFPRLLGGAGIG